MKKGNQSAEGISSPVKRKPGMSCHQCRQIRDFLVGCKNMPMNKLCSIKLCHKCLLKRYGEKVDEVSLLEDWKCPKCRGICNCSICMKKRGCQPIGPLMHTTEATRYFSVSNMLQINNIDQIKALKDMSGSWKKINITNNEERIVSSKNSGKENYIEEILDLKKGQPEAVLRDILQGRSSQHENYSLMIQFVRHLLSFLKEEEEERSSAETLTEGKNLWYAYIKMLILKSPGVSRTMGLDSLSNDVEEFKNLNPLQKLKILNFICDEVLGTIKIRDWIDDQNSNFAAKAKEEKEKVIAAKDEEKRLKQKMQNENSQAIIAMNGAPLSILEDEAIVSQIKHEAPEVHASPLESMNIYFKYKQRSEALRTEPFFSGADGKVYWTLKCYGDKSILLCQDVETGDTATSDEKWSAFDAEQKEIIEKHIHSLRAKRRVRTSKVQQKLPSQDNDTTP